MLGTSSEAHTTTTPSTLGTIGRTMLAVETPPTCAASINSCSSGLASARARYAPYPARTPCRWRQRSAGYSDQKGHQQDDEEHKREGVEDLQQTHHHQIHFAAEITGGEPYSVPRITATSAAATPTISEMRPPIATRPADRARRSRFRVWPEVHIRGIGHHAPVGIEVGERRYHRREGNEQCNKHQSIIRLVTAAQLCIKRRRASCQRLRPPLPASH